MLKFSIVISFYNEGVRILKVLEHLSINKTLFGEIVCVDDGSIDNASELISSNFPLVKLIKIPKNVGKSGAVHTGVMNATEENIILMDADLKNADSLNWGELLTVYGEH